MNRRALIVCDVTAAGGVDRYVIDLARHARQAQWQTVVALDDHPGADLLAAALLRQGETVVRGTLHKRHDESLRTAFVEALVREHRPPVMHVVLPAPWAGVVPRRLATREQLRLVCTEQLVDDSFTLTPKLQREIVSFYRYSIRHIAVSDANRRLLAEHFGLPAEQLTVIPNSVDPDVWRPATPDERETARRHLPAGESPWMITLARLNEQKGIDILLAACARPEMRARAWTLYIAGDGPDEEQLKRQCDELDLTVRVRWLGWRDDAAALLAAADLFVLPSRYEGQPFALLEAMSAGVPVAACAVSGIPEALDYGRLGKLAPAQDPAGLARTLAEALDEDLHAQAKMAREFILRRHHLGDNMKKTLGYWSAD
ncbi:MAG TPA: glycosyltransferase family 4 protein [bacterium]|nr:glycosyltransferase family 4 protein [bacterium]